MFWQEFFIVEIHDFFIKKDIVYSSALNMDQFMSFSSSYIITGNGESFSPYQTLSAGSLHIVDVENMHKDYKFLLHSNFPYLSVGISFSINFYKTKQNRTYSMFGDPVSPCSSWNIVRSGSDLFFMFIENKRLERLKDPRMFDLKVIQIGRAHV